MKRNVKQMKAKQNWLHAVTAVTALSAVPLTQAEPEHKPNIIFVMVDDLGYGDLGVYGQQHIQTPHLDQMAAEGILFTDVYAEAVCAPARSVLMTGLHTGNTRVRANSDSGRSPSSVQDPYGVWRVPLELEDVTVAEVLRDAGYVTGITGKWGLGEEGTTGIPNLQGFDEWYGLLNQRQAHSHYPAFMWRDQVKEDLPGNTGTRTDFVNEEHYAHHLFTDFAFDFIERHTAANDPFFLYLPYTLPHDRFQIPELAPYTQNQGWTQQQQVYASMVTLLDYDMGRMLQLLRDLNIDDNTLVFFCSDNGAANRYDNVFDSSGPLRGRKRDLYEGGIRTPMLVWGPGNVPPGTVSTVAWSFADVLPTLADAAGATPPPDIDGVSVLPTLLGQEQPELVDRPIYFELHEGLFQQAIRRGKWKAVRRDPPSSTELYDLSVDIGESNNIASQHPDIVEEMEALFISMRSPSVGWPTVLDYDEISDDEPVSGWLPLSETEGLTAADHSGRDVSGELHNVEGNPWGHDESGPYLTLNAAQQQVLRIEGTTGASQAHPRTPCFCITLRGESPGTTPCLPS